MKNRNLLGLFVVLFGLGVLSASAQQKMSSAQYIDRYKSIAIDKMKNYGIPASITLAQGLLESGNGGSELAVKANNHFGIKCGKSWTGPRIYHDDDKKDDCFRKYSSVEESYRDHSIFLKESSRYKSLFELERTDYKGWAEGLEKAGYATNPMYAELLIDLVNRNKLYQWDIPQTMGGIFGSKIFIGEGNAPTQMMHVGLTWGRCNGVKYVLARRGDSYITLAKKLHISPSRLMGFNDLEFAEPLAADERVFIQRKKAKSSMQNSHIVMAGETSYSISQEFGIKLRNLKKMNKQLRKSPPTIGESLRLN
ncbi:MAG: glucosaminidase domain-containing protein [Mucinivorans sp.]